MRNLQEKKGFKYIVRTKPFLIIFAVFLCFFSYSIFGLVIKMQETASNKKITEEKIKELQDRKDKLTSDLSKLETDKGKEEIFRENYGLAKQGEGMIVIVDDKNKSPVVVQKKDAGFISFFANLFK